VNPVKDKDGEKKLELKNQYHIKWNTLGGIENKDLRYYFIEIK